jgi:hypothetical protein
MAKVVGSDWIGKSISSDEVDGEDQKGQGKV